MPGCFVPDCNHSIECHTCTFFRFPGDRKLRRKWLQLIRRQDRDPEIDDKVCSCHFEGGDREQLPTKFQRNVEKQLTFTSPEKFTRRKRSKGEDVKENRENAPVIQEENQENAPAIQEENEGNAPVRQYEFSTDFHKAEKYFLEKEIEKLREEVRRLTLQNFGFFSIANNEEKCLFYTGVRIEVFELLEKVCSTINFKYYDGKRVEQIPFKDQLLLTLMKLRLNYAYNDLGWRFGVSDTTAFRVVSTFIPVLHKLVFQTVMRKMPSRRKNGYALPLTFATYTSCRAVIDCTEFRCQIPKKMDQQRSTYSSYKHYNTLKVLLGVAPNAAVVYCSPCYPGCTSDKEIVAHCGILKELQVGDMILADKGFLIGDILPPGTSVNIPPFLTSPQFTPSQKAKTRSIAKARIHVERANSRLKNFNVVQYFPKSLFCRASMIVQTCAGLINFQNTLIREIEQYFHTVPDDVDAEDDE